MIEYLIVIAILFLTFFYYFLEWKSKRQLIKLREGYKPENDTSRREFQPGAVKARHSPVIQREPSIERNAESERRELLQAPSDPIATTDEREPSEAKPKRWWSRRKKVSEVDKIESQTL